MVGRRNATEVNALYGTHGVITSFTAAVLCCLRAGRVSKRSVSQLREGWPRGSSDPLPPRRKMDSNPSVPPHGARSLRPIFRFTLSLLIGPFARLFSVVVAEPNQIGSGSYFLPSTVYQCFIVTKWTLHPA